MVFSPNQTERLARARADLRMGVPIVLEVGALVLAGETLDQARLDAVKALAGTPSLAITRWRAQTLRAQVYDGDLARILLPADADRKWIQSVADPEDDLRSPMKGPLRTLREGDATAHRQAIKLVKDARLLPAALVLPLDDPAGFASQNDLTFVPASSVNDTALRPLERVVTGRLPLTVSEAGKLHIFRPMTALKSITPSRSASRTARNRSSRACIPPALPVICWARSNAIAGRNCAARCGKWVMRARVSCST